MKIENELNYDPSTGAFTWKTPKRGRRQKLGSICTKGYLQISVDGKKYMAHRLAWYLTYNRWPTEIDHINRVKLDNRISNLREVSHKENCLNQENVLEKNMKIIFKT